MTFPDNARRSTSSKRIQDYSDRMTTRNIKSGKSCFFLMFNGSRLTFVELETSDKRSVATLLDTSTSHINCTCEAWLMSYSHIIPTVDRQTHQILCG